MDNRKKSVEYLNNAVAEELTAVHQYMYFHFVLEDLGYDPLAKLFHRIAITEMTHVEELAERIFYLGGDVDMKVSKITRKVHEVKQILELAVALETESIEDYNRFAHACSEVGDSASKQLFEGLVKVEEEHQDTFQTELDNFVRFGDEYLALQSHEHSKSVAKGHPEGHPGGE